MLPSTLEAGSFGAGWHLSRSSPGSSTVYPGSIGIHRDSCIIVALRGVGGVILGAIARFWVLSGLIPPVPSGARVVGARVGRCQLLFEHFHYVVVVFYDLDQFCDMFFERIWGWGVFDLSGHPNGEAQNEESFDISLTDIVACFSGQGSELPDIFVYVVPLQLQPFQRDHGLGFPLRILEMSLKGLNEIVPDVSVFEGVVQDIALFTGEVHYVRALDQCQGQGYFADVCVEGRGISVQAEVVLESVDEVVCFVSISLEDDGEGPHGSGVSSHGIVAPAAAHASSWVSSSSRVSSSSWGSSRVTSKRGSGSPGVRSSLSGVSDVDGAWVLGLGVGHLDPTGG